MGRSRSAPDSEAPRGEGTSLADASSMRRALRLAAEGWGRVHPNPMVGALVVRDGTVIAEGFHGEYGKAHAEVEALDRAGERAEGGTLYVSLEPCSHHGKTPPCTEAIVRAGVSRVVFAASEPWAVAGGGAERLRRAGIEVVGGVLDDEARGQNAAYFHWAEVGTPFVALKLAQSLDGRISARPGVRTDITGKDAVRRVHRLRAGFDAILVGGETARVDDPMLTVRWDRPPRVPPVRVVVGSGAGLGPSACLLQTLEQAPLWLIAPDDAPADRIRALESAGARVSTLPRTSADGVDPRAILATLAENGIRSVLCEGGARLAGTLLRADLVQRLHLHIAPILLGEGAVAWPAGTLPEPVRGGWRLRSAERLGGDALLTVDRARAPSGAMKE